MDHLSSSGVRICWDNISNADNTNGLLKMAVNDTTERYFGAIIGQIQSFGKIELNNAGLVSQVRVNIDISRGFDTG